jgi:hypothetical protein
MSDRIKCSYVPNDPLCHNGIYIVRARKTTTVLDAPPPPKKYGREVKYSKKGPYAGARTGERHLSVKKKPAERQK